jgi:hypothetical protein
MPELAVRAVLVGSIIITLGRKISTVTVMVGTCLFLLITRCVSTGLELEPVGKVAAELTAKAQERLEIQVPLETQDRRELLLQGLV